MKQDPTAHHDLVVFGPDWGRHPSVSQHVFSQFIGKSRIIWIETVGMRSPTLSWRDVKRSWQKLVDFGRARSSKGRLTKAATPGVHVVTPVTLPFTAWKIVRLFNLWQVRRAVARATERLGLKDFSLVTTVPSQCDYVGRLGEARSIYYCIDDYALWPGMDNAHVRRMEAKLVAAVDAIVVSSDALVASMSGMAQPGKPIALLTHGVDTKHFGGASVHRIGQAFEIVYFGLIDERTDQELLLDLAAALPSAVIRLIGPVATDVSRLAAVANIKLEGPVAYQDLPLAVATAGLFILPYKLNALAMSINPIKIKEYLACGKPVVATALPEVVKLSGVVSVADSHASFVEMARAASVGRLPFDRHLVAEFVAKESWQAKAEQLGALLGGLQRPTAWHATQGTPTKGSQNGAPDVSLAPQTSF